MALIINHQTNDISASSGTVTIAGAAVGGGGGGQTITAITVNTTLSNSDKGKLIQTETSGITITIPALSSLDADWFVDIETLNTNTFNHGKITLDITTNNTGASINRGGNETMYGASKIRLQRSPAGGDAEGQLSAFASNYLTGGIIVREDRLAGGLQGGDVGVGSIMLGNAQNASGNDAIAIGQLGSATGTGSVAIGSYNGSSATTVAAATGAVAIGSGRAGGTRSLAIQINDSSTTYGATNTSSIAMGFRSKASGSYGFAAGYQNIASGNYSVALGRNSTSAGAQGFAAGYLSEAAAINSTAFGFRSKTRVDGQLAVTSGYFGAAGDAQSSIYTLRSDTTDATAEALTTTNGIASATNQVVLSNDSVYGFTGTIIAREDSAATNDFAVWEVKGGAVRAASAATTALGSYNINKISESTGAAAWSIAISADTTNGVIAFTVTGEASHSIRWVATINTTEVIY